MDDNTQTRRTKPDLSATPENVLNSAEVQGKTTLDSQGHTTDVPGDPGNTDGIMATAQGGTERPADADDSLETAGETAPKKEDTVNFTGPFTSNGVTVSDSEGRTVAMVTGGHLSPETREEAGRWLAGKLNAA